MIRRMLQSIVWKELRELRVWSAMLFAGFFLGLLANSDIQQHHQFSVPMSHSFLFVTTFGSALVGTILGLMQTVPERRMGLWPFLAHRPLEPNWMFLGKVVAGCGLYVAIVGIPTLVFNMWYAVPGHMLGPYYWAMAIPGLVDVLTGFVYYFAAFSLGCSEVRRMPVGLLGLGLPVATSFATQQLSSVVYVAVVLIVTTVVSAYVALQSYVLPHRERGRRRVRAIATLGMALPGVVVVSIFAICCFWSIVPTVSTYKAYDNLALDGTPIVTTMNGSTIAEIRTLDGTRMTELEQSLFAPNADQSKLVRSLGRVMVPYEHGYRDLHRLVGPMTFDYGRDDLWYWSSIDRVAYLYSRRSRQHVLTLALPDVDPVQVRADRFNLVAVPFDNNGTVLCFPKSVYRLVRGAGSGVITHMVSPPAGERIVKYGSMYSWNDKERQFQGSSALFTDSNKIGFLRVDRDDLPWLSLPPGFEADGVADLGERFVVTSTDETTGVRSYLTCDTTGAIVSTAKVDTSQPTFTWSVFVAAIVIPGLSMVGVGVLFLVSAGQAQGEELTWLTAFVTVAFVAGVASVIWGNRRLMRAGFDRFNRWTWGIVNFFGGPVGLLWMRYQIEWPATIECEACHRPRHVVRETCEHCDADHALPVRDGTEILV